MPVISVAIHPIAPEQKRDLIAKLTETATKITNIPPEKYVVFIDEYDNEAIGLAGKTRADLIADSSL